MSYQNVKDKLYHGHRKIANNTYLELISHELIEEYITMRLHGHTVAVFTPKHLELYSAGWHATTTKNRLNLALELAGIGSWIYQARHQWYYGCGYKDHPLFKDGMKISYNGEVI